MHPWTSHRIMSGSKLSLILAFAVALSAAVGCANTNPTAVEQPPMRGTELPFVPTPR